MNHEELDVLSRKVMSAAYIVHSAMGPGLLESAYIACLVFELQKAGLEVKTEVPVPLVYENVKLADVGYRLDLLVENELIVEVKAREALAPVHFAQLVSYLKLANRRLGLLINFHVSSLKDGIHRRVNNF
jgi:GxxExxY protein